MTRKPIDTTWPHPPGESAEERGKHGPGKHREVRRVDEDKATDERPPSMTPAGSGREKADEAERDATR